MYAATEVIGLMASLTSFLIGLPHVTRVWKYRDDPAELRGIAMGTQVIGLAGSFLWGAYAVLTAQVWVGAPALVNGPIAIATIIVLRRAHHAVQGGGWVDVEAIIAEDIDRILEPVLAEVAPDRSAGIDRDLVAA